MAAATITPQKLTAYNDFLTAAASSGMFTAVDASAGGLIDFGHKDFKAILLIQNGHATDAKSVTIKAGNGIQGNKDITLEIAAGKYTAVCIESGRFKNVSGTNVGKVLVTGTSTDIKVACFVLP